MKIKILKSNESNLSENGRKRLKFEAEFENRFPDIYLNHFESITSILQEDKLRDIQNQLVVDFRDKGKEIYKFSKPYVTVLDVES